MTTIQASEVEISNKTPADTLKVIAAVVLAVGGFVAYYMLIGQQAPWVRGVILGVSLLVSVLLFLTSSTGKSLREFFRSAYIETQRVVWPERKETVQMTMVVFGFVVIMSIFLWVIDKLIEYALFDVLLNWAK